MNNIVFFPFFDGTLPEITYSLMLKIVSGTVFIIFALMYFLGEVRIL